VYESREEIPLEYRWNLADILQNTAAFDGAVAKVEAAIPKIQAYQGRLGESPEVLADALALLYDTDPTVEDLYVWAAQWRREDTRNAEAQKYEARARGLLAKYSEAVAFFNPEIAQIPDEKIAKWRAHPRLATYDHMIDDIVRTKEHIRSAEIEEVLAGAALLTDSPRQVYGNLHDADLEWPTIEGADGQQVTATPSLLPDVLRLEVRQQLRRGRGGGGTLSRRGQGRRGRLSGNAQARRQRVPDGRAQACRGRHDRSRGDPGRHGAVRRDPRRAGEAAGKLSPSTRGEG
jgi:oligoendopeptidase F